jgi:hypothetical protein
LGGRIPSDLLGLCALPPSTRSDAAANRGNVYSTKGQPDLAIEDYDDRATSWVRHHTD